MTTNYQHQAILSGYLKTRLNASQAHVNEAGIMTPIKQLPEQQLQATVILNNVDINSFVSNGLIFLAKQAPDVLINWYHQFTKTIFLIGNSNKLTSLINFSHVSDDGSLAWCSPVTPLQWRQQTRLLKQFQSTQTLNNNTYCIKTPLHDATGTLKHKTYTLLIAVRGLTLNKYLVHLNHAICETYIMGLLRETGTLIINNVDDIVDIPEPAPYVRVHIDHETPTQLRAYAVLNIDNTEIAQPREKNAK